jgi:hypothetical protein
MKLANQEAQRFNHEYRRTGRVEDGYKVGGGDRVGEVGTRAKLWQFTVTKRTPRWRPTVTKRTKWQSPGRKCRGRGHVQLPQSLSGSQANRLTRTMAELAAQHWPTSLRYAPLRWPVAPTSGIGELKSDICHLASFLAFHAALKRLCCWGQVNRISRGGSPHLGLSQVLIPWQTPCLLRFPNGCSWPRTICSRRSGRG